MNILYIGAGFVGTCSAAVAADSGHKALVFDIDQKKIQMLGSCERDTIESCLYEKGLGDLLIRAKDRLIFTTDYTRVEIFLDTADAVFMCLPTPEIGETGESDLSFYDRAAEQLAQALAKRNMGTQSKYIVIINKSTVPVDMSDRTIETLKKQGVKNFGVVSNPEFLVEGKAIEGSLKPDRVVIGASSDKDFEVMRQIYERFYHSPDARYIEVNPHEAEAGKLLANFYLFNKVALCFDVIGRTCEAFDGLQFENVRKILMTDDRIGTWGLYDSLYAGGSCLVKDTRSLAYQLQKAGMNNDFVTESYDANKRQLQNFVARFEKEAAGNWSGLHVAILGLAFKRDTNDTRNAPAAEIIDALKEKNVASFRLYDPSATNNFQIRYPASDTLQYFSHEYDAIKNADVIILATDWPQFRGLADILIAEKKRPVIMDGRRMLQHRYTDLVAAGFDVIAVGSPFLKGK
ncbi:MAG: hypothetical protein A3B90_00280 [Candidatus Magasanikbacteria bacterium RIFCSPHIGHO2_02_FULL_41_13]|uniref:UDP-glucose 6-dehydrogenase n=1 Tax=Candidatus Magasanikbacteria bacterium RIFCSPHIGHO2_02_FULL_41_13 TaxID=1798676 RepID=A0A1F6M445_9BACT|nr:MAG: hypothetical protein A3B90_00280 [Candidatus Magasanikbacteria bacterium RIFCSPHIGHO2_02_FULL_41_13]